MEKSIRDMCMDQVMYEYGAPCGELSKTIIKNDKSIAARYQRIVEDALCTVCTLLEQEKNKEIALSPEQKCRILWLTNRIVDNYYGISHPNLKEEPK